MNDGYADIGVVRVPKEWHVKEDVGLWKVHVRYQDGDVYVSAESWTTHEEAMAAAETFVLESLQGTQH